MRKLFFLMALTAAAHEIPNDVTVQMFVKPDGSILHVLVRVPFIALRDINFPERASAEKSADKASFLDLRQTELLLPDAAHLWISNFINLYENDRELPKPAATRIRISLPNDRSFQSFDTALAHVRSAPLPGDTQLYWNQPMLDVLFDYPIRSAHDDFSIHPGLARLGLRVTTVMRFVLPDGAVRALEYQGDPGLVRLDPHWYQAAGRFVHLGFDHILDGTDHLLFLLCLVIPFRKFRALLPIVTAFTVAHSITLIASAYNLAPDALWFPPLIEVLIALSIFYMAIENIAGASGVHKRWIIAFGFGLIHGFGFSFALRDTLQFAGRHMLTSLLSFNIGVELGQLLVLLLMIPALELGFRYVVKERMGTIILSAIVAHTAWHWMIDRWTVFSQYRIEWPALTPAFLVTVTRWLLAGAIIAAGLWLVNLIARSRQVSPARIKQD